MTHLLSPSNCTQLVFSSISNFPRFEAALLIKTNLRRNLTQVRLPKMDSLVIIKYGGGLITFKDKVCEANYEAIQGLNEAIQSLVQNNYKVIIVHGAGGFGHIKAKKWKLHLGLQSGLEGQSEAVEAVRNDMKALSSILTSNLDSCHIFHPHQCQFKGTRYPHLQCDLQDIFGALQRNHIPVLHGDVVKVENVKQQFGILSGDDICVKLVEEAYQKYKVHMIFAMTGAEGVMDLPPTHPNSQLIPQWHPNIEPMPILHHNQEIDVTGGIRLKLEACTQIAKYIDNTWILNGHWPKRILEAVMEAKTIGTSIFNKIQNT